ncbi:MAG: caspase family protein, partial [Spirochaetales bacterium]|nr:caspase family protein [Spirochaetales bacterium]
MKRPSAVVMVVALAAMLTAPAFAEKRVALVIGNGAYTASPLSNPPNDAKDMAALFRGADMAVVDRTNLDLAGMEKAVSDFVKLLKGADSAVVYYAGHGVQVGGENYLVPVRETVGSEAQVRSRSMAVSDLLERIKGTGVKTIILFLDACRDNPFPGSSRSAARGLSVVPTVADVETVVAFATEPGKTAADGGGRNGVFTAALLKNLAQPGLNIAEAMIQVRADVLAATGGEQQPRLDLGLSRPWYLVDPAVAAAKAQAAAAESQAQLAALDKEMADRQARIAAAKDAASREALELEQRKQEASRAAKQLEAESLARTAELRRQAADAEARKQEQVQASVRAQEELSAAMAKRRAELEKLGAQGAAADPDAMVATVERFKAAITEIEGQFESSWREAERGIRSGFDPLFAVLAKAEPELWETDAEYERRKATDRGKLDADMAGTLANRKAALEAELKKQTATLTAQLATALKALEAKTWTVPASQVRVTVGDYDRNTRLWPVSVESLDPAVEATEQFVIDFNKSKDIKTELVAFDRAVKAGALAGEVCWGIRPDPANGRYLVVLKNITLRNLENGKAVASSAPGK